VEETRGRAAAVTGVDQREGAAVVAGVDPGTNGLGSCRLNVFTDQLS
jgi:hypothetical protein